MKYRKFIDLCAVVLVLAFAAMMAVLFISSRISGPSWEGRAEATKSYLDGIGVGATIAFCIASIGLWLNAFKVYWNTLSQRGFIKNAWYFLLLLGFSWLAAVVVYAHERDKRGHQPARRGIRPGER